LRPKRNAGGSSQITGSFENVYAVAFRLGGLDQDDISKIKVDIGPDSELLALIARS